MPASQLETSPVAPRVEKPSRLYDRSCSMTETETESASSSDSSTIVETSLSLWELDETTTGELIHESSPAPQSVSPELQRDVQKLSKDDSDVLFPTDIDQWSLVTILGEGNFGQVWQVAHQEEDGNKHCMKPTYALKMMSKYEIVCDDQVDMVLKEKRILQLLSDKGHPFIINLRAAWQDDNLIYFLQDFLQGGELYSRMLHSDASLDCSNSSMPLRQALPEAHVQFYVACIADALHYMHHRHQVCYRDLKPENVMLNTLGYPTLIDLGAAKQLLDNDTRTYTMVGTPRYMSPELIDGSGHSFGVDHWALGVLAYELLTGDHPFDEWDNSNDACLFAVIAEEEYLPLEPPETISEEAQAWIHVLLVKDPAQRLGHNVVNGDVDDDGNVSPLLRHTWLSNMPLSALRQQQVVAPWKPKVQDHNDSSHFDDWGHLESVVQPTYPRLHAQDASLFDSF